MKERQIVVLVFAFVFIRELFVLVPYSEKTFDPFPFYDQQITRQTYVYFACYYCSMLIIAYCFTQLLTEFKLIAHVLFCLQTVELIDYFMTYNTPWFHIFGIEIGITLVKFVILFIFITYKLWKN